MGKTLVVNEARPRTDAPRSGGGMAVTRSGVAVVDLTAEAITNINPSDIVIKLPWLGQFFFESI